MGSYHRSPTGRRPRTAPLSWRRGPGQLCPHSNLAPGVWMSKPRLALEQRRGSWIGDPRVGAGAPGGVEVGYNKASLAEPQVPGCGTPPLHPHPHGGTGWDVQVHSLDKKSGNLRELGAWPGPRLGDVCVCWGAVLSATDVHRQIRKGSSGVQPLSMATLAPGPPAARSACLSLFCPGWCQGS